jgi:hypothetical protein
LDENCPHAVDGVVVGAFTPSGTAYQGLHHHRVHRRGGSHTIAFQGLGSAGGDNTALIDDVTVHFV